MIRNPEAAIDALIDRLQAVFASHFAIDALRFYRGDERSAPWPRAFSARSRSSGCPTAETVEEKLPDWIIPITNSRLIVSRTGAAFLVDGGNQRVVEEVRRLKREGKIKQLDGIYITHYHDDHTNLAQAMADEHHCPVYFCKEMRDILEHPEAYRMPCLTPNAIRSGRAMEEGAQQKWNEFEFTYSYFPGPDHLSRAAARCARRRQDDPIRRRFLHAYRDGRLLPAQPEFLRARERISGLPARPAQDHRRLPADQSARGAGVPFFSGQLDFMIETFSRRRTLIAALVPWSDPNFGVDEQWARFYPYTAEVAAGGRVELKVMVRNHACDTAGIPGDAARALGLERAARSAARDRAGAAGAIGQLSGDRGRGGSGNRYGRRGFRNLGITRVGGVDGDGEITDSGQQPCSLAMLLESGPCIADRRQLNLHAFSTFR